MCVCIPGRTYSGETSASRRGDSLDKRRSARIPSCRPGSAGGRARAGRAHSSVGQSSGLIIRRSQVRVLLGPSPVRLSGSERGPASERSGGAAFRSCHGPSLFAGSVMSRGRDRKARTMIWNPTFRLRGITQEDLRGVRVVAVAVIMVAVPPGRVGGVLDVDGVQTGCRRSRTGADLPPFAIGSTSPSEYEVCRWNT